MIRYKCGKCGVKLESPAEMVGRSDPCPSCGAMNVVPPPKSRKTVYIGIGVAALVLAASALVAYWPIGNPSKPALPADHGKSATPAVVAAKPTSPGLQRLGVVIGINNYADPAIPALKYAESDAQAVFDTLTDPAVGRFPKENVKLLVGKEATNDAIKEALYNLRGAGKDDLVVVFFSGHGAKEGDEAFWVTQTAKAGALPATALSNSDIRRRLADIPSQRLVVFLDCCYAASTVKKSLSDPGKLFGDFAGKGRVTIAGSGDNQEAVEYPDKKAGVFTYYLVSGLRGAADTNGDGIVTFDELWTYMGENVRKAAVKQGGLHEPVIITESGFTPQFLLTFNPAAKGAAEDAMKGLTTLFGENKITAAQFDAGRKALSYPPLDAAAIARRDVFLDLTRGKLDPKYLDVALVKIENPVDTPASADPNAKPTMAIVPFRVLGDVKGKDVGAIIAEQLLPLFAQNYELIDQAQLGRFLDQDDLTIADLAEFAAAPHTKALTKAVRLKAVRYLLVGTVSGLPDGTLSVTARLSEWQTGRIANGRVAQVAADDWKQLGSRLPDLSGRLIGDAFDWVGPGSGTPSLKAPIYEEWHFDANEAVRRQEETAKNLGIKKELTLDLGNKVTMKLVLIPAGEFLMGSPGDEPNRSPDEGPQRAVTISKPFYMGVCTVTQAQWKAVMGTTIAQQVVKAGKNSHLYGEGDDYPMYFVSWDEAVEFCKKLSQKTRNTVSLPTEAQWEYACRAGSNTRFSYGDEDDKLGDYAWYAGNDPNMHETNMHPVGQKKPYAFGLYDMHGNVWQWCSDWYAYYPDSERPPPPGFVGIATDPTGPATGTKRVLRGGCWSSDPHGCRSAYRNSVVIYSTPPPPGGDSITPKGFRVTVDLQ